MKKEIEKSLGNIPIMIQQLKSIGIDPRFMELGVECSVDMIEAYSKYAKNLGLYAKMSHIDGHELECGVFRFYPNDIFTDATFLQMKRYASMLKIVTKAENGEFKDGKDLFKAFIPFLDMVVNVEDTGDIRVVESASYYYFVSECDDFNGFHSEDIGAKFKTSVRKGKFDSHKKLVDTAKALCLEMI